MRACAQQGQQGQQQRRPLHAARTPCLAMPAAPWPAPTVARHSCTRPQLAAARLRRAARAASRPLAQGGERAQGGRELREGQLARRPVGSAQPAPQTSPSRHQPISRTCAKGAAWDGFAGQPTGARQAKVGDLSGEAALVGGRGAAQAERTHTRVWWDRVSRAALLSPTLPRSPEQHIVCGKITVRDAQSVQEHQCGCDIVQLFKCRGQGAAVAAAVGKLSPAPSPSESPGRSPASAPTVSRIQRRCGLCMPGSSNKPRLRACTRVPSEHSVCRAVQGSWLRWLDLECNTAGQSGPHSALTLPTLCTACLDNPHCRVPVAPLIYNGLADAKGMRLRNAWLGDGQSRRGQAGARTCCPSTPSNAHICMLPHRHTGAPVQCWGGAACGTTPPPAARPARRQHLRCPGGPEAQRC